MKSRLLLAICAVCFLAASAGVHERGSAGTSSSTLQRRPKLRYLFRTIDARVQPQRDVNRPLASQSFGTVRWLTKASLIVDCADEVPLEVA